MLQTVKVLVRIAANARGVVVTAARVAEREGGEEGSGRRSSSCSSDRLADEDENEDEDAESLGMDVVALPLLHVSQYCYR